MYFYRSKSTLDGLKSVFHVFRRKLSLGAPLCVVGENREIKIHVYDIRQTANVSWEFLRIENKQLKTVQNDSFG